MASHRTERNTSIVPPSPPGKARTLDIKEIEKPFITSYYLSFKY
jgi:hypothetical protein